MLHCIFNTSLVHPTLHFLGSSHYTYQINFDPYKIRWRRRIIFRAQVLRYTDATIHHFLDCPPLNQLTNPFILKADINEINPLLWFFQLDILAHNLDN